MLYRAGKTTVNLNPRAFAACLSLMGLIACARTAPSADNPDGVDPPQDNPHPKEIVKIRVLAPSSLHVLLYENYHAPSGQGFGSMLGPGLCQKDPTRSEHLGHYKQVPITLTGSNGDYSGTFTADRYLPGRCEWGFDGISSNFKEDIPALYQFGGPSPANPHGPEQVANIWCGTNPILTEPSRFICTSLHFFSKYTKGLPDALLAAHPYIPSRANEDRIFMDDTTKSIVLHYHDLEAEAKAARSANSKTTR
jgi:hypothetical protein